MRPIAAQRLAESRHRSQLTTREVGAAVGVAQSYITNLETGRNQPNSWQLLRELCLLYDVSPAYILGITDCVSGENSSEIEELYQRLTEASRREARRLMQHLLLQESESYRAELFAQLVAADPAARPLLAALLQEPSELVDPSVLALLQQSD